MDIEQNDGARSVDHAHRAQPHSFVKGPPGAGPMAVCVNCGEKETPYTVRAECPGKPATGMVVTAHDYDPFA
jgi:hypothetical protein